jgi:transposase
MTTETRKRREYTEDFKRDAVALVTEQGYKVSEAARSLDIGDGLIRRWKREYEDEASGARLGTKPPIPIVESPFPGRWTHWACHV